MRSNYSRSSNSIVKQGMEMLLYLLPVSGLRFSGSVPPSLQSSAFCERAADVRADVQRGEALPFGDHQREGELGGLVCICYHCLDLSCVVDCGKFNFKYTFSRHFCS